VPYKPISPIVSSALQHKVLSLVTGGPVGDIRSDDIPVKVTC